MDQNDQQNLNTPEENVTVEQPVESFAKKPHHRMESIGEPQNKLFKLRNILNLVFMVITMAGMLTYFLLPAYKNAAFIAMIIAVVIKFIEVALRMFHK